MSNTFFQGGAKTFSHFSRETKPAAALLVTGLIIGNDFFVFHKFALPSTFFCPCPTDVPASLVTPQRLECKTARRKT